jgi:hypothetical protein
MLGAGLWIGINDMDGKPIHIGDTLEFDEKEFGEECIFTLTLEKGEFQHPGSVSDLSAWCKVIKPFCEEE